MGLKLLILCEMKDAKIKFRDVMALVKDYAMVLALQDVLAAPMVPLLR